MRIRPAALGAAAVLAAIVSGTGTALAACLPGDITTVTYAGTTLPPYNPFTSYAPKLVTVTVSAQRSCSVELAFQAPTSPPRLTGFSSLNYDVQLPSTSVSLIYTGGTPSNTAPLDIGAGNVGSATVQVSLPAGQVVGDGTYTDSSVLTQVFDRSGSTLTLLKSVSLPLSGTVARVCQFMSPSSPTLNFTPAIANGMPRASYVQTVTFQDISCTAPSLVRLSAAPMQLNPPAAPTASFDSAIHFRANASFSGANAVLDTSTGSDAASVARNTGAGPTTGGMIRIDVNLLAGKPLLPGTYSSTLTVSVDPTP